MCFMFLIKCDGVISYRLGFVLKASFFWHIFELRHTYG
ncbi:hypothetical protein M976_03651 [Buttiauxella ferragutiae ATCC 51602]|uniref:Uncharacterized protein n=1 Tax=Buttiauxella ferragutiae ATCC 51602 TaxID=1354252 RepID=A0ABX2W4B0_9ENTR|nr:hypothetical protein M976_03651 [Buttiauxella ferragutiae ATCC 51602]